MSFDSTSSRIFGGTISITTMLALFFSLITLTSLHAAREVSATLAWDADPEESAEGYIVHFGTKSGVYDRSIDVGPAVRAIVPDLVEGTVYYFVVTAYNADELQGAPSEELEVLPVVRIVPDGYLPAQIDGFSRTDGETFHFKLTRGSGVARVLLYASSDLMNWTLLEELENPQLSLEALDVDAADEPRRFYRLTSEFESEGN
jgi:hypothetical protein